MSEEHKITFGKSAFIDEPHREIFRLAEDNLKYADENITLRAELERARGDFNQSVYLYTVQRDQMVSLNAELEQAQAENARLRELLQSLHDHVEEMQEWHKWYCDYTHGTGMKCDCGGTEMRESIRAALAGKDAK